AAVAKPGPRDLRGRVRPSRRIERPAGRQGDPATGAGARLVPPCERSSWGGGHRTEIRWWRGRRRRAPVTPPPCSAWSPSPSPRDGEELRARQPPRLLLMAPP